MPQDFAGKNISILIDHFCGIYHAIAEKANINGGQTLEGEEISLFYKAQTTIDKNKSIFIFDGQVYDDRGNLYLPENITEAKKDALDYRMPRTSPPEDILKSVEAERTNKAALEKVKKYMENESQIKIQHQETVKKIANSWAETYHVNNRDGSFNKFVEKLYEAAKELNITKTNSGLTSETFKPSAKYPTIEDQIVDEMCAAFANESKFETDAVSGNKLYYGIFQFSQIGLNDIIGHGYLKTGKLAHIKGNRIQNFTKLTRLEQLEYMLAYVDNSKKYYSKVDGKPISPKQMYATWVDPWAAKENPNAKQVSLINKQASVINAKQAERDKNSKL